MNKYILTAACGLAFSAASAQTKSFIVRIMVQIEFHAVFLLGG